MAKVKQYFTFRKFIVGRAELNPKVVIQNSFPGVVSLKYQYICGDYTRDGRHLGLIEVDTAELPLDTIAEAMQVFAYRARTNEEALELARHLTTRTDLMLDKTGTIVFPVQDRMGV